MSLILLTKKVVTFKKKSFYYETVDSTNQESTYKSKRGTELSLNF